MPIDEILEIAKHFNPRPGLLAVMGTAVYSPGLTFLDFPFIRFLAEFLFLLRFAILFLLALAPWTVGFFFFTENIGERPEPPRGGPFLPDHADLGWSSWPWIF